MKKTPFILLIAIFFLSSCDLLSDLTQFDLPYEKTVSIPIVAASDSILNIATPSINTGISAAMDNYNTGLDLIDEISLTSMTLTLTSPAGGDLGFLSTIAVYINTTGQEEIQLAYDTDVAADVGAVLELSTSTADIQDYIKSDDFSLRFELGTDETVLEEHVITMNMVTHVDARVLGL
ncbi:hypothetical protein ACFLQX_03105 [Bacteroidota bacterium]